MEKQGVTWFNKRGKIFVHILIWCIVFAMPIIPLMRLEIFNWNYLQTYIPMFISYIIVFYANYLYFVDKLLFRRKTIKFIVINILIVIAIALLLQLWYEIEFSLKLANDTIIIPEQFFPPRQPRFWDKFRFRLMFIIRDISSITFVSILGIVTKSTERVTQMQTRQKEMEKTMIEVELKNLKNQINPHFLLNTLNNIYALSVTNSAKTSKSIMELSELLRYLLYKDDVTYVPLKEEVLFLTNYIDLMRLRLTENVNVTTNININEEGSTEIAPLIYISLIENAFKHGVSNDDPSFVVIELTEHRDGKVYFSCKNSYFPKGESDHSGSGIGLQHVKKSLDLLYPERYIWSTEIVNSIYSTVLIINTLEKHELDT